MKVHCVNALNFTDRVNMTRSSLYALAGLFLFSNSIYAEWFLGADVIPSTEFYQLNSLAIDDSAPTGNFDYQSQSLLHRIHELV